jgi:hypothetical protein
MHPKPGINLNVAYTVAEFEGLKEPPTTFWSTMVGMVVLALQLSVVAFPFITVTRTPKPLDLNPKT